MIEKPLGTACLDFTADSLEIHVALLRAIHENNREAYKEAVQDFGALCARWRNMRVPKE